MPVTLTANLSYASPDLGVIIDTTQINLDALGMEQAELEALVAALLARAESETALGVTQGLFLSGTLTSSQVSVLQEAVSYRVAARFLKACASRKAQGTYEPLLVEDSREITELVADFENAAAHLEGLVARGEGQEATNFLSRFIAPLDDPDLAPVFSRGKRW